MKPVDPIFAPICYGDDRQVGRNRRGLHNIFESFLDPNYVYCHCRRQDCKYKWRIPKSDYLIPGTGGTGNPSYWPDEFKPNNNLGIGGTGQMEIARTNEKYVHPLGMIIERGGTGKAAYGKFTEIDGCRAGGIKNFSPDESYNSEDILILRKFPCLGGEDGWGTATENFIQTIDPSAPYPYETYELNSGEVGCTGGIDPNTIESEYYLSDYINSLYENEKYTEFDSYRLTESEFESNNLIGRSGGPGDLSFKKPPPKAWGSYPIVCPNCLRVNFKITWVELEDNPTLGATNQTLGQFFLKNPTADLEDFTIFNICKMVIITDYQCKNIDRN